MGRNWLLGLILMEVEETMSLICVLGIFVMLYMNYYMGGNGLLVQVMVSLSFSMTQKKVIFLRHRCFASLEEYQKKSFRPDILIQIGLTKTAPLHEPLCK